MPHRVIYASRSLIDGWGPDLLAIARAAFRRNAALGVTGALYFDRLRFFQLLEGPEGAVSELMRAIREDGRHAGVQVLSQGWTPSRRFAGWSLRVLDGDADPALRAAFPDPATLGPEPAEAAERFVGALAAH